MANYMVTTSYTSTIGNGLDLPGAGDFAYIGPGVMLGSALDDGRGIFASNAGTSVQIAGSVFGRVGVEFGFFAGTVTVVPGGSIFASFTAVAFQQSGTVNNAGAISGIFGITSGADIAITNAGTIAGDYNGINIGGELVLVNTGLVTGGNLALLTSGAAYFTNLGTISGGISTGSADDTILNQGSVAGNISTSFGADLVDSSGGRVFGIVNLASGDDTYIGGSFADQVLGGEGRDDLAGAGGDDRFYARDADGNDDIDGGAGIDLYDASLMSLAVNVNLTAGLARSGGTGADRFVWTDFEEFLAVTSGLDRITDFVAGQDQIDLSGIDALAATADQAFTFVGAGPITDFGQISIRTTASATFVAISLNSAAPFEVIRLDGVIALTAADFVL